MTKINEIEIILEETTARLDKAIPSELKEKLKSKDFRKELLDSVGRTAFLDPDNLKFPIKDETGKYVCQLVYAAYLRAKMNISRKTHKNGVPPSYYQSIANKAKILFGSNKCDESMKITLHEGDEIDYVTFFDLFDLSELKNENLFEFVED